MNQPLPRDWPRRVAEWKKVLPHILDGTIPTYWEPPAYHGKPCVDDLINEAARIFGVRPEFVRHKGGQPPGILAARRAVMWALRIRAGRSYSQIARDMGMTDHTSVMYGIKRLEEVIAHDDDYRAKVALVLQLVPVEES